MVSNKRASLDIEPEEGTTTEEDEEEGTTTQEDDIPEAFTPQFTVVPDDIPAEQQVHLPTEEEQKATLDSLYKKVGVKAKEFITSPPQEITPEKQQFVNTTTRLSARILSTVMSWGFSVFGWEYGLLAPTHEQAAKIIEPAMRIVARHSKIVGNVSPDIEDGIDCLTAISDYAVVCMQLMEEIREDKKANNGRYTGNNINARETRTSNSPPRSTPIRGYPTNGSQHTENGEATPAVPTDNLTYYEQYNATMLSRLRERDFAYRARRHT